MIFSILLIVATSIFTFIVSLFPTGDPVPEQVGDAIAYVVNPLFFFDGIINMDVLFTCVLIALSFELILATIAFGRWVIGFIPFFKN